jgi:hypothetical protein
MDSAQLYLDLLDSGERVLEALAEEREANVFRAGVLGYLDWEERLWKARRGVESAAERYAVALRVFRAAVMSELAPSEPARSPQPAPGAKHRERAAASPAASRNKGRTARKEIAAEGFPASSRVSKVQ